jgi:predicted ATP-dependent serine protease
MEKYKKLSEIKAVPIWRRDTGFEELDFIYGFSKYPDFTFWGLPNGKISLWAGTSGIGKSRLAIDVAKNVSKSAGRVLYFQTESELSDFAEWANSTEDYPNILCSGVSDLASMIEIIKEVDPVLVFIDSVNEIDDFSGNAKSAKRLIKGSGDQIGLKQAIKDLNTGLHETHGCHLVLLGQLNGDGSIKGGTSLPHLVDIALNLVPFDKTSKSMFTVKVGIKHRCGRRDDHIWASWIHGEDGVRSITSNRLCDKPWCDTYGLQVMTRGEMLTRHIKRDVAPKEESVSQCVAPKEESSRAGFLGWLVSGVK